MGFEKMRHFFFPDWVSDWWQLTFALLSKAKSLRMKGTLQTEHVQWVTERRKEKDVEDRCEKREKIKERGVTES